MPSFRLPAHPREQFGSVGHDLVALWLFICKHISLFHHLCIPILNDDTIPWLPVSPNTLKIIASVGPLTSYFQVLLHKQQLLLWRWQEELGLFQRGGSQVVECHHISGQWVGFHALDNILPVRQPHSQELLLVGQLKVPPVFQWLCIPEI